MLHLRCGLVPACLTLSALFALPTLADPLAMPKAQAAAAQPIVLQHVTPGTILKSAEWDQTGHLPAGVTQIVAVPLQNALLVTATPAGFAKVRETVKVLDIEPRQAQIKFAVASVSNADLKASGLQFDLSPLSAIDMKRGFTGFIQYTSGSGAAQFLQTLSDKQAVTEEPDMTTSNNVESSVSMSSAELLVASQQIRVTPRVNSDNSVTLDLHAAFSKGAEKRQVNTLRTVKSGGVLLFVLPPAAVGDENLLLFVSPTIK